MRILLKDLMQYWAYLMLYQIGVRFKVNYGFDIYAKVYAKLPTLVIPSIFNTRS